MSITQTLPHILVVDDNTCNLDLVCKIFAKANVKISTALDGIDAINQVKLNPPELILLDGMMPKLDGFETCRLLKEDPITCDIPIIFMTALAETERKVKAFKLGASDYITKPFQKAELMARVEYQLELLNLRQTLEKQNDLLQREIEEKYEVELSLLDTNERLADVNQSLIAEIENRKTAEKKLKQSLKEKELLLKEIHHRVKNNLFIVSSLLDSQAEYIDNPQILKMLSDSQNRITSMALIHEQLHSSTSLCQIDFQQYLITLTDYLIDSYLTNTIQVSTNIQQVYLNIETANACGLIINELISNAVEHAFKGRNQGNISLEFTQNDDQFTLIIKDDGIGFPEHKNFYHSESLGLELVSTLVEQLEGKIEMTNDNGTEVRITFAELNYKDRL